MKVLESPDPSEWKYVFTCVACKAKLEATVSDFHYVFDSRDGDALVCTCPVCKRQQWISADRVPPHVKVAVRG